MSGVSFHRLYTPYARLQLDYDVRVDISQNKNEWADLPFEKYDVVVFNRWLGHLQYNILPILAKKKVPFICDNDDYWVLPRHNPAYKFYRAYLKNGVKDATQMLSLALRHNLRKKYEILILTSISCQMR